MIEAPISNSRLAGIGVATGLLSGLLGIGGGLIMVPMLIGAGFTRHKANSTSLAAIWLIAIAGSTAFASAGAVDWRTGILLGLGGLVGAAIGAQIMKGLKARTLALIFGLIMLATGLRMVIGGDPDQGASPGGGMLVVVGLTVGMVAGLASGLAGIGGGVVMVPAMVLLMGLGQHLAQGTSLLAIVFTATSGTVVNARNRLIDWRAVGWLGIIGAATAPVAALLVQRVPADQLARVFGMCVVLVAVRTILRGRSAPSGET